MGVCAAIVTALTAGCSSDFVGGFPAGANAAPETPATIEESPRLPPGGAIERGDCIEAATFSVADCGEPHELEVFRFIELPADFSDTYPSAEVLLPRYEPQCRAELPGYVGSADVDASRLRGYVYWPSPQAWDTGERWVLCAAVVVGADERPVEHTGVLRGVLREGLGPYQACSQTAPSEGPLHIVPCVEPHRGEAVPGVLVLGAPTSPPLTGEDANELADPHCRRVIDEYLGTPGGQFGVRYSWRYPTPESWPNGYTSVVCYAETEEPITGTLGTPQAP